MLTYLIYFTPFQIGSRYIVRRLVQKVYDMALAIGLRGYAQMYVAESFQILYKENLIINWLNIFLIFLLKLI